MGLAGFKDKVTLPVISGNIDVSQSNVLVGRVQSHVVLGIDAVAGGHSRRLLSSKDPRRMGPDPT